MPLVTDEKILSIVSFNAAFRFELCRKSSHIYVVSFDDERKTRTLDRPGLFHFMLLDYIAYLLL